MFKFYIFLGLMLGIVALINFLEKGSKNPVDFSVYEKKPFLFDAVSELNLYKILVDLYSNEYRIFAQVQYSHLIEPKKSLSWTEQRKYRSRIDKKSADFVICHKDTVVPLLVIELDGSAHEQAKVKLNDEFKNNVTNVAGLPLLRLSTQGLTKELIKSEVDKKLRS